MYPSDRRYTAEHEWVQRISADVVRFGITAYAAQALGDVVFVELPVVGSQLVAGESCGEVESTKSVSDIYAPVDGVVLAVNEELADSPETVNASPYSDGWMVDVTCADPMAVDAAWEALMSASEYESRVA